MSISGKVFNCPIHGHIELCKFRLINAIDVAVIDTPQFQRLRELKQLGVTYYVYPGATHNRFEHSIGVCHLAGQWLSILRKSQPELGITDSDLKCIRLAGLAHDLGHGPFSHLFDGLFIPHIDPESNWTHEKASVLMLQSIIDENRSLDITPEELVFVKDLILGRPSSNYLQAKKAFMFDIVANQRNSIDVDKFDYILRDCHNVGMKTPLDPTRLMTFSKVIDNQICFNQKEAFNLYELFRSRYTLFKQVYTHRVSTAIEYMIRDILISADSALHISVDIYDMSRYLFLNDSIICFIERSQDENLKEARTILRRLRQRDLYRFADQTIVPPELWEEVTPERINAQEIFKYCEGNEKMESNDIIVQWLTLGYAMKERNPIDSVGFFTKYNESKIISIKKEHVSGFIPEHYKEVNVRIYSRQPELTGRIQLGFRRLLDILNASLDTVLTAESIEQSMVTEISVGPITDTLRNPFLTSPTYPSSAKSRRTAEIFSSPASKRILEVNDGLSIPNSNLKKRRNL